MVEALRRQRQTISEFIDSLDYTVKKKKKKKPTIGDRGMALSPHKPVALAVAALSEDLSSDHLIHVEWHTTVCNHSSRRVAILKP